ncbi:MAG: adenylyl-sulfate kinase [Omnitrophica bacterium GWA2_52_12]|nr:MAG: adenylyl-sulfate kinase [Omnitrophica bacterium GWA2_52_12]
MPTKKENQGQQEKMNIVIVGHVDHGKSTVIGRLLADTDSLPKGKLEQVRADCERNAKPFEYAFLLDALKDERAQGITIDTARCFFKSKKREYIIIDAPGHIEFLKNMVSGAARAEAALLIIDAREGVQENSRRHGYLLSMLGIRQVAVCVNKMDLVNYSEQEFRKIVAEYSRFLEQIGLQPKFFVPVAAFKGENMTEPSVSMPWHKGPSILEVLDLFQKGEPDEKKPFRMPVQAIYKFTEQNDDRRIVAGRVESGSIAVGDSVVFLPSRKRSEIKSIEVFNASPKTRVSSGDSTGFTLKEQIYINRGEIMCKAGDPLPQVSSLLKVKIFWMGKKPMVFDKEYRLKLGTLRVPVSLKKLTKVIDASDLKKADKSQIERHDVAECVLEATWPVAFDLTADIEATGRFVIVDDYDIAGGGIITETVDDKQGEVREQVSAREEKWDFSIVEPATRTQKYGHRAKLILLTGPVGVDKKSIAKEVEKQLFEKGRKTYFLGIGNLLRGVDADMARHKKSRHEHVRRLGEVGHIMVDAGLICLATASNLDDEELRLLQEIVSRDDLVIINVGASHFRDSAVDLQLKESERLDAQVKKALTLIEESVQGE